MTEFILPLGKVRCMNCANKIHTALTTLPNIEHVEVDTQRAIIIGNVELAPIMSTITALGYEAGYQHILPLQGLSCGKCVAKVEAALAENNQITDFSVTKTQASVTGAITEPNLITLIETLGYSVPTEHTFHFALSGLNCGKCVKKIENSLAEQATVSDFTISKTQATITAKNEADTLISLIKSLGFMAKKVDGTEAVVNHADIEISHTKDTPNIGPIQEDASSSTLQFLLSGMTCASCVSSVEKAILAVPGVEQANINLAERTALVTGTASDQHIITAIINAGYGAELSADEQTRRARQQKQNDTTYRLHMRNAFVSLGLGIPLMAWGLLGGNMTINSSSSQIAWGVIGIVTFALLITAGRHFFINAWKAFVHHRATMDTLVALGTGSAWLFSMLVVIAPDIFPEPARHVYFEASAMILGLITVGHALEAKARSRTSKALERLIDLQPQTAIVIINGNEQEVPLADVQAGMLVRLHPGSKIPVDGIVEEGQSYIDESMLTGEPIPANKQAGDKVHAGTMNQNGSLIFKAEHIGSNTMLARIIQLVRQAQSSKPALARLADTISAIFVPSVMIIAIITAMAWYYFGPEPSSIYMLITATTILIIACPCALGLATPMSVTVGVGRAAEYGILIRDAEAMQLAADIDTVVLDKTGTLTEGKPQVVNIHTYNDIQSNYLLNLAASLEQGSEHPLARAIIDAANTEELSLLKQQSFEAKPGFGVIGKVSEHQLLLGNARLLQQHHINIDAADEDVHIIASKGATPIYMAIDNQLAGVFGVSDPLRQDSISAVKRMKAMNLNVVMLTGDTLVTANAIANEAGIDTVIAGVLPDGKAAKIAELQQQGHKVAMVGDGINDAPALALAEVGIAMGSGSDIAIESAQFALMRHSLHGVVDAIQLSKATLKNMKQNLFGAFIYNSLGIPIAAGVLFPLTGTLLSPVIAGAAMALSSITVVSNANRLRLFKPNQLEK